MSPDPEHPRRVPGGEEGVLQGEDDRPRGRDPVVAKTGQEREGDCKPDRLDQTGEAGDGVAPRHLKHLPDDRRDLHRVVGRAGPGADLLRGIEDLEGEEPLRVAGGGNADDVVDDPLGEQRFQEPGRHPA